MVNKIRICCLLLFSIVITLNAQVGKDSLLAELDHAILNRTKYDQIKENRILQLKKDLRKTKDQFQQYKLINAIIEEYIPHQLDSTLYYMDKNMALAHHFSDKKYVDKVRIDLAGVLSSTGNYKESVDILNSIEENDLDQQTLIHFYEESMWVYYRLYFYSPLPDSRNLYNERYEFYMTKLLKKLPVNSTHYLSVIERLYREKNDYTKSIEVNNELLKRHKMGTRKFSMFAFSQALNYRTTGNKKLEKKYLALSALSDIKASVKDNAANTELAQILFKEGDLERAHHYINFAFEDAAYFNSKLRFVSISNVLPIIDKAYESAIHTKNEKLRFSLIAISILSFIVICTLFYIYKQNRNLSLARKKLENLNLKLNELNQKLVLTNEKLSKSYDEISEIDQVKEYYIANLLVNISENIDSLDSYGKTVVKLIVSQKIDELLKFTKNKNFLTNELNKFYYNFDRIFLNIYPTFITDFNALLIDEEKIYLKENELLNTELRIFALIRLGINDSAKIAKILRYSVTTIYNYRVRTKNKAKINRSDFESEVLKIGALINNPNRN